MVSPYFFVFVMCWLLQSVLQSNKCWSWI